MILPRVSRLVRSGRSILSVLIFCAAFAPVRSEGRLVIKSALIVDGSGAPPRRADLAIEDGIVTAIGEVSPQPGDAVFSAAGKIVAPGFIDLHNHSSEGLLDEPEAATQVSQGITTLVLGPDGSSPFPPGRYLAQLESQGIAVNAALLVGHGTLRSTIMGSDYRRQADVSEIEAMAALVDVAMRQGAFGLSSGLEYDPGFYSSTEELIALAKVAAAHGGIYMTHIRDEEEGFLDALREAALIGRQSGAPVQISHIKLGNTRVWGRTDEALEILQTANRQGVDVLADCYPYNAWASHLSILVPSRKFEDRSQIEDGFEKVGGAEKVLITRYPADPSFEFKTVDELARARNVAAPDVFVEMMQNGGAGVVCQSMSDADVHAFYQNPLVMAASDGGLDSRHPRKAGTFTRVLGNFVRERKLLKLEEAIQKMTSLPARRLGLADRGTIRVGGRADLVVFDPETVADRATFQQPDLLSVGIELVLVNGRPVWENGAVTGQLPGAVLRKKSR